MAEIPGATAVSNFSNNLSQTFSSQNSQVVIFLVIGIVLAFVTAYVLYYVISKTISNQQSYLLPDTKVPVLATQESVFSGKKIPPSGNGYRYSINFWIYIYDIQKFNGMNRHILHRGIETDVPGVAGPYIYLDANTNKIFVTFPASNPQHTFDQTTFAGAYGTNYNSNFTNSAGTTNIPTAGKTPTDAELRFMNATRGIVLPYVPLQRWVQVVVVVNEDATLGGSISAYVDTELVNNVSTSTQITGLKDNNGALLNPQPQFNISDVNLDLPGNIYVGGSIDSVVGPGFSGMVSLITFFNYDMNSNDVYELYKKGPVDNMLAKLGLPAYGLQSPIYRLGDSASK